MGCEVIDLSVIRHAELHTDPYLFFSGSNFISADAVPGVQTSYPDLKKPGWFPSVDMRFEGAFAALMADLESEELRETLADKLGERLKGAARFITIRKYSAPHEGSIHVDGEAKAGNFLVYLNDDWNGEHEGCLRVLRNGDSFDDYVAEVRPTTGTIFGFRPSRYSWHGHLPFTGERRAIQVSWLRNEADLRRKSDERAGWAQVFPRTHTGRRFCVWPYWPSRRRSGSCGSRGGAYRANTAEIRCCDEETMQRQEWLVRRFEQVTKIVDRMHRLRTETWRLSCLVLVLGALFGRGAHLAPRARLSVHSDRRRRRVLSWQLKCIASGAQWRTRASQARIEG